MNKWTSYCVKEELNDNSDCTFPRPYVLFWNVWMRLIEYCCSNSTILFPNYSKSQLCRIFITNLWRQDLWSRIQSLLYGLIGEPQSPSSWKIFPTLAVLEIYWLQLLRIIIHPSPCQFLYVSMFGRNTLSLI